MFLVQMTANCSSHLVFPYGQKKKEWTEDELVRQLHPMLVTEEGSNGFDKNGTLENIVSHLLEKQRQLRSGKSSQTFECGCSESNCFNEKANQSLESILRGTSTKDSCDNQVPYVAGTRNNVIIASPHIALSSEIECPNMHLDNSVQCSNQVPKNEFNSNASTPVIVNLSHLNNGTGFLILNNSSKGSTPIISSASVTPLSIPSLFYSDPSSLNLMNKSESMSPKIENGNDSVIGNLDYTEHISYNILVKEVNNDLSKSTCTNFNFAHSVQNSENLKKEENSNCCSNSTSMVNNNQGSLSDDEDIPVLVNNDPRTVLPNRNCIASVHKFPSRGDSDLCMFGETLDLSQEDIQRTLIANMPQCLKEEKEVPMDISLAENDATDEIYFNLDAFDMFNDFSELDTSDNISSSFSLPNLPEVSSCHSLISNSLTNNHSNPPKINSNSDSISVTKPAIKQLVEESKLNSAYDKNNVEERTVVIVDYSPEWAFPEGGSKVLVIGPWYSNSNYSVLFDGIPVPTKLIHNGVLKCHCPAHEVGHVNLQVSCEGYVVSNTVIFEYKQRPQKNALIVNDVGQIDEEILLKCILWQRVEAIQNKIRKMSSMFHGNQQINLLNNFEDIIIQKCCELGDQKWKSDPTLSLDASPNNLSLLHVASILGYERLIKSLLLWNAKVCSDVVTREIDPSRKDSLGYTPLMHACFNGRTEAALALLSWDWQSIRLKNNKGQTALDLAALQGHSEIITEIQKLENAKEVSKFSSHLMSTEISPVSADKSCSKYSQESAMLSRKLANSNQLALVKRLSLDSGIQSSNTSSSNYFARLDAGKRSSLESGIETSSSLKNDRSSSLQLHSNHSMGAETCSELMSSEIKEEPFGHFPNCDSEPGLSRQNSYGSCDLSGSPSLEQDTRVLTLAEQIIAALPERIKKEKDEVCLLCSDGTLSSELNIQMKFQNKNMDVEVKEIDTSSNDDMTYKNEFNFQFSDNNYRYYDVETPASSLSPASSSCLQSPCSATIDSPSPPPTTADFTEFFQASGMIMERDFSNLTLSDREQRELYEAAKIIQKAYRSYKGRKRQEEQDRERVAATVIQNYYRRYQQYAYFKQMTKAAMVIQHQFRSYCEHKRFKKNQDDIASYFKSHKDQQDRLRQSREGTPTSSCLKRVMLQRRQHQAARKIQQFMRQSRNKLQRERALAAEKERVARESSHPETHLPNFQVE